MTNADKIRSMTNEEMEKFFRDSCPPPLYEQECPVNDCDVCWTTWLNQQVPPTKGTRSHGA